MIVIAVQSVNIVLLFVFCQAEDGIRDLVRSRGLGDVYKRQGFGSEERPAGDDSFAGSFAAGNHGAGGVTLDAHACLLYTSDAADERSSVDLGGRRII